MKVHRPAALAACAAAAAAAVLTAVPASAAAAAPTPVYCIWRVEHTSSVHIRDGLPLRTGHGDKYPLVRPHLPSRLLNGTEVTGNARNVFRNKKEHIVWSFVRVTKLVHGDPAGDLSKKGWVPSGNGHGTHYLRLVLCTRSVTPAGS